MGFIGVGGRGGANFKAFFDTLGEQALAICDVDLRPLNRPFSDYDHSAPLTELVLLGCISQQVEGELKWDTRHGRFTNSEAANALLTPHIRSGFEIG